jgi:hypothetical protein
MAWEEFLLDPCLMKGWFGWCGMLKIQLNQPNLGRVFIGSMFGGRLVEGSAQEPTHFFSHFDHEPFY